MQFSNSMHHMYMKLLFICVLLISSCSWGQVDSLSTDSLRVVLPTQELKFKPVSKPSRPKSKQNGRFSAFEYKGDSIFAKSYSNQNFFLYFGQDSNYIEARLPIPELRYHDGKVFYNVRLDSLETEHPYLIISWYWGQEAIQSTHSGNGDLMCQNTQTTHSKNNEGMTILSLNTRRIIFHGITKIQSKEVEVRYPGGSRRTIEDDRKEPVRLRNRLLCLFYSDWGDYFIEEKKKYLNGFYLVKDERFERFKK